MRGKQNKKKEDDNAGHTSSIRKKAEEKLAKNPLPLPEFSTESAIEIIHELQVHQIELEMQTEELRNTQLALLESRDKYLDLYEFAPVGYLTLTKKGLITDLNLTAAVLLGVKRTTIKNNGFGQFIATHNISLWEQFLVEVRTSKEKKSCELELVRKDASHFYVRLEGITLQLPDSSPDIRIAMIDITQEFKAKIALEKSEKRYRQLIELAHEGIWAIDAEGKTTYVNPSMAEMLGYSVDEMMGKHIFSFIARDDKELAKKRLDLRKQGITERFEFEFIRKDGNRTYTRLSASPILHDTGVYQGAIAVVNNISERKRSEDNLRETTEYLQKLLDYANAPIIVWDPTFLITRFNSAFEHLTGRTEEDVLGKSLDLLFPIESSEASLSLIRKTLEGERWKTVEIPIINIDGSIKTVLWNSANVQDSKGKIISTIAQGWDISKRKQIEAELQKALAEKEVLLGEVHHRVKNNFAGVISLIDLQCNSVNDPIIISHFKDLEVRIRSMAIVHELLYVTKDFVQINFDSYSEELVHYLFQVYEKATEIKYKIEVGGIMMPIKTVIPCGQVISEIITNSLKYAFPDTFSCKEKRGEECIISVTMRYEGSDYLLSVADNGIGIQEAVDNTSSKSLGIFLIRFIVEHQLQGNLEINTLKGTAYNIRFPMRVS